MVAAGVLLQAASASAQLHADVTYAFSGPGVGQPAGPLVEGADGNLYGTSQGGYGTVFRLSRSGTVTLVHSFNPLVDGYDPIGGLVLGSDGNIYGQTAAGGPTGFGTIFKVTPSGNLTVVHDFNPNEHQSAGLVQANDGNLYGLMSVVGPTGQWVAFRLTPTGDFTEIHSSGPSDPNPISSLTSEPSPPVLGTDGSLYGIGAMGAAYVVYRLTTSGTVTILHTFVSGVEPGLFTTNLVVGIDGALYGAAEFPETLFRVDQTGALTVVHNFQSDGFFPWGSLTVGADGTLYGTSRGSACIFKMTSAGVTTGLLQHQCDQDTLYLHRLVLASDGNLYAAAYSSFSASSDAGTVLGLSIDGAVRFENVLSWSHDGGAPYSLSPGPDERVYGLAYWGGATNVGVMFSVDKTGAVQVVRDFPALNGSVVPMSNLALGADGNFYFVSTSPASFSAIELSRITPTGVVTNVVQLGQLSHLLPAISGVLVATSGGQLVGSLSGSGIATGFRVSLDGTGLQEFFPSGTPLGFVETPGGSLLGLARGDRTTQSSVFRLNPDNSETVLHMFTGQNGDGRQPTGTLVRGADGSYYGTTQDGGAMGHGMVFRVAEDGTFAIVYSFTASLDGAHPSASLLSARDGYLYGSTSQAGLYGFGTLFRMTADGTMSVLHAFTGGNDGGPPDIPLVELPDGSMIGAIPSGGFFGTGVIVHLTAAPRILQNPVGLRVHVGDPVSLTAAADGATAVQWRVSRDHGQTFSDIPGATSSTYAFLADLTDNGARFLAVFTNGAGAAPTGPATLIVRRNDLPVTADLDADGVSDLIVWRPDSGTWYSLTSLSGLDYAAFGAHQWGSSAAGDVPLTGDLDGDGAADLVVWRASTGTWYWLTSSTGYDVDSGHRLQWGNQALGDVPLLADIDGDGRSDLIVWRASTGTWYWLTSSTGYSYAAAGSQQWGSGAAGDVPFVADVDGDGRADLIVWRASTGTWYWLTSSTAYSYTAAAAIQWGSGAEGDQPLLGDIDGDGRADPVVWRPSTGTWFWLTSSTGYGYETAGVTQWGAPGDVPLLRDFDGDGRADLAVWRPSTGTWYWLQSSSGFSYATAQLKQWGASGDIPIVR